MDSSLRRRQTLQLPPALRPRSTSSRPRQFRLLPALPVVPCVPPHVTSCLILVRKTDSTGIWLPRTVQVCYALCRSVTSSLSDSPHAHDSCPAPSRFLAASSTRSRIGSLERSSATVCCLRAMSGSCGANCTCRLRLTLASVLSQALERRPRMNTFAARATTRLQPGQRLTRLRVELHLARRANMGTRG